MSIAICNGSEVVYLLSDAADVSQWPLVVDGSSSFINGVPFAHTVITGVSVDTDIPLNYLSSDGVAVTVDTARLTVDTESAKVVKREHYQNQIDDIERGTLLNRGSREFELVSCQDLAARKAVILQPSMPGKTLAEITALVLAANVYYNKLTALNDQVTAIRVAMAAV